MVRNAQKITPKTAQKKESQKILIRERVQVIEEPKKLPSKLQSGLPLLQ